MMFSVRRDLVVIACVSVGFIVSAGPGLLARAAEPDRWVGAIATNASTSVERGQRRVAELEQRVKELEAERASAQRGSESPAVAAAMARNEELEARNHALQELVQSRAFEQPARATAVCQPPNDADPRAQLRYWGKQLRDGETAYGRLSPEWHAALNVLVRRERELDPHNPWR
jgi:hypothetical protein